MENDVLPNWNDGAARRALVDFVTSVTEAGSEFVEPEARVAAFDNDGTLWCEKPSAIRAAADGWLVVSMKNDWATVF
jgi:hypothetical protein